MKGTRLKLCSAVALAIAAIALFSHSMASDTDTAEAGKTTAPLPGTGAIKDENIVRAYYRAAEARPYNEELLSTFFADDYTSYPPLKVAPGVSAKQGALQLLKNLSQGFPDGKRTFVVVEPLSSDRVLVYFVFNGTHSGQFFGYPASGNKVSFTGVDILKIADGKFVENHHVEDVSALLEQVKSR